VIAAWFSDRGLAFDTETTAPDPELALLVSATAVEVGPKGADRRGQWLVNPGVPIPAEASAIHGISDDIAATGWNLAEAVPEISEVLLEGWRHGLPLIAMNASYDLTVMQRARARLGLPPLTLGPVLDPLVIDRGVDPYRKGKRTLTHLAAHYGVKQEGAHSSSGDALCAARVVWKQARVYAALARFDLDQMQAWQRDAHAAWATNYQQHLRGKGDLSAVISTDWPVRQSTKEAA